MNESYFESIIAIFDEKPPFLSILDTFWAIFGQFSNSTSINDLLTIELNNLLNWINRFFFELNNILNRILGKAILNRILNESFFGKFQHWIESERVSNTPNALRRHILSNSDETMIKIVVRQGCGSVLMEEACYRVRSKWSLVPVVHIGDDWDYAYWLESQLLKSNNNLDKKTC